MRLDTDFFSLFQLPPRFALDPEQLSARYLDLRREAHPDRLAATNNAPQKRLALQWSARINEGFETLKQPIKRALYLLELHGVAAGIKDNAAMPPEFLMEHMEWRETVMAARHEKNMTKLEQTRTRVNEQLAKHLHTLAQLLDEAQDFPAAAELTRRLLFLEKLQRDIDDALFALEEDA
ncbi:MAG: Fe-S protein assembly co-chaperone HscB [Zoogloeaceae bacterium]|jgi:molecular chaperone HscB|nr:Fe-S protein assembly co-chaperone HscB [Zoogloeaceae bacterium]